VHAWKERVRSGQEQASLLIGGFVMDNMEPRCFIWSRQPLFPLEEGAQTMAIALIEAANAFSLALAGAISAVLGGEGLGGTAKDALREEFYIETQAEFESLLRRLFDGEDNSVIANDWCAACRRVALILFERVALPGLAQRRVVDIESIVSAHARLKAAFNGYGEKTGKVAYKALQLPLPKKRKTPEELA